MFEVFTRPFKIAKELNVLALAIRARNVFTGNYTRAYFQSVALNKVAAMVYFQDRKKAEDKAPNIIKSQIAELFEVLLQMMDKDEKITISGGVSGHPCFLACECLDSPQLALSHLNAYCEQHGIDLAECVKDYLEGKFNE